MCVGRSNSNLKAYHMYHSLSHNTLCQCRVCCCIFSEAMYMSGDLWEQLLATERERVKELENSFAEKMREKGVSV